ncbi:MAG: IS1634 family transposase [Thermoplasmata archaeon]
MPPGPANLHLAAIPGRKGTYYYLAHSRREGKRVLTDYLIKFGRLSPDQAANVRAWVEGLKANPWASPPQPTDLAKLEFEENLPGFRHGIVALGHAAFGRIGLRSALSDALGRSPEKGFRLKLLEALVLNRLEDPSSKLRLAEEWYGRTSLPHLLDLAISSFDEDDLYETLDLLDARRDRIEALVYERVIRPLEGGDGPGGVLMKDLSSTYFEGQGVRSTLEAKGYSRDRVRGSLQVNWSLVLTPKGYPVTLEIYPGNTKDETTVPGTVERLRRVFGLTAGTFVGDRGMLTGTNLELLHEAGFHYVVAETLWNEKEVLAEASKKAREPLNLMQVPETGQQSRLDVGVALKEAEAPPEESWCEVVGTDGRRHIVIYSEAKKQDELESLGERLDTGRAIEKWARAGVTRGEWTEVNHHELVKSVTKRLVKEGADLLYEVEWNQDTIGGLNLIVNKARKNWEETKAGWWMLTTDTELTGPEVVKVYKSLAVVERAFRTIKGMIRVRPVRHQLDRRIRAHLYVCVLAYLVERWVQQKVREGGGKEWAHLTGEQALEEIREGRLQQVGIEGTEIRRWKMAGFTRVAERVLDKLELRGEVMKVPRLL